jgi:DNA-binding transcriptional LysR family regulator
MDRFLAMNVFVAVADQRGFAPAARRLALSPSAATRLVSALEEKLGTRLLTRTTRSVSLTQAGARYLERARRILADLHEAEDAAQSERSKPVGRFVVAAPNMFGRLHVAPLICQLLTRHPELTAELTLADRMINLVEDGVDAAVRIGVLEDSSLVARNVGATRRVVVASPRYLAANKKLRTPHDLGSHKIIQFNAISPAPVWRFWQHENEVRVPITPIYVTNSGDAAIGHALLGGGLTMALAYQVTDAVRAGKLAVVLNKFEPPPLPISIVYPSSRLLSAKVRAFVELVTSSCDWRFLGS